MVTHVEEENEDKYQWMVTYVEEKYEYFWMVTYVEDK